MTREHRPATEEGRCTTERISLFAISLVAAWPPGTRTASWKSAGKGLQGKFYADAEKDVMTSRISSLGFTAPVHISY